MEPHQFFKALSDPTRLRCLSLLSENSEFCVCELTKAMDIPQPKVSHHLAALRKAALVLDRKEGLWIHYRINPDLPAWIKDVIHTTATGTRNQEPFSSDSAALSIVPDKFASLCSA